MSWGDPMSSCSDRLIRTLPVLCLAMLLALAPQVAAARVMLAFHSFTGSILHGRYPHAFIALSGTLEGSGRRVAENYGYTPVRLGPEIFEGNVPAKVHVEGRKYLAMTNRHFAVPLSDAQYRAVVAEVRRWRDGPGIARYNLKSNNCIHFVARFAAMAGLRVEVPDGMALRPREWLNHIAALNPALGAAAVP